MPRPVLITFAIGSLCSLGSCASHRDRPPIPPSAAVTTSPPSYASHEFKFTIAPGKLPELKELLCMKAEDQRKCRVVRFFDTSSRTLLNSKYSLRMREKLDDDDCAIGTKVDEWDGTWKWRGDPSDATLTREARGGSPPSIERDVFWKSTVSESSEASFKFEDEGCGKAPPPAEMVLSASDAIRALVGDAALSATCAVPIYERRWKPAYKRDIIENVDVSCWSYDKVGPCGILEVSFKVDDEKLEEGKKLADLLGAKLEAKKLLKTPMSKTTWARKNCPQS